MLVEAVAAGRDDSDEPGDPDGDGVEQLSLDSMVKPADWPEGKNWETISIDASCAPADTSCPADWRLLNEATHSAEKIIDDLYLQSPGFCCHRPRYNRQKSSCQLSHDRQAERPRHPKLKAAVRRQLSCLQLSLEANDALIAVGATWLRNFALSRQPVRTWRSTTRTTSCVIRMAFDAGTARNQRDHRPVGSWVPAKSTITICWRLQLRTAVDF